MESDCCVRQPKNGNLSIVVVDRMKREKGDVVSLDKDLKRI